MIQVSDRYPVYCGCFIECNGPCSVLHPPYAPVFIRVIGSCRNAVKLSPSSLISPYIGRGGYFNPADIIPFPEVKPFDIGLFHNYAWCPPFPYGNGFYGGLFRQPDGSGISFSGLIRTASVQGIMDGCFRIEAGEFHLCLLFEYKPLFVIEGSGYDPFRFTCAG